MKYLVDFTVYGRYLAGLDGYMEAFEFINKNVPDLASLDIIHADTIDYAYRVISDEGFDVSEVFMRLSNVVRSMIDSTITRFIEHNRYVEEAMHLASEHEIEPRNMLYLAAARGEGLILVTMDRRLGIFDDVLVLEF